MRLLLIVITLAIITPHTYGQQEAKVDSLNLLIADSACVNERFSRKIYQSIIKESQRLKYIKGQVDALKNHGTMMYCLGKTDSATYYFRKGAYLAGHNNLNEMAGKLFNNVGYMYQMAGKYDSSIYNFNKALKLAKQLENKVILGTVYTGIGIVQQHIGQLDSAVNTYLEVYKLAEKSDLLELKLLAMVNISTIHYDHFPERLNVEGLHDNLKLARQIGHLRYEISFLEFLGYLASDSSEHDKSIEYFNQALNVNKKLKDQNAQVLILQG